VLLVGVFPHADAAQRDTPGQRGPSCYTVSGARHNHLRQGNVAVVGQGAGQGLRLGQFVDMVDWVNTTQKGSMSMTTATQGKAGNRGGQRVGQSPGRRPRDEGAQGNGRKPSQATSTGGSKSKPVNVVRMGALKAAIWENQIAQGTIHNVTVSRTYKLGDEYRESQSFGFDDLLPLAKALNAAHSFINDARAKSRAGARQQGEDAQQQEEEEGADEPGETPDNAGTDFP
jgi:hypothetical protein